MSFQIDSILLYGPEEQPRIIALRLGELNIITGYSKTGKSSLISIVHYCMGADECGVAYGRIRSTVEWYGLRLVLRDRQIVVARKAPSEGKQSSSAVYFEVGRQVPIRPKSSISPTTNVETLVELLSEAAGIVDNEHTASAGQSRPSLTANIKHALSFCLQPQDEIISRRNLFFHQGEPFVRQAIQDVLPYFLGAVSDDYIVKVAQLRELRHEYRRVSKRAAELRALAGHGSSFATALLSQAVDLGLLVAPAAPPSPPQTIDLLRAAADRALPSTMDTEDPSFREYERLLEEREQLSNRLRRVESDLQGTKSLMTERQGFASEGAEQANRLRSLRLLPESPDTHACPLCGSQSEAAGPVALAAALRQVESELASLDDASPHLLRLVADLERQASVLRQQLGVVRESLEGLNRSRQQVSQYRDFAARAAHVRGRISVYLESVRTDSGTDALEALEERLENLDQVMAQVGADLSDRAVQERVDSLTAVVSRYLTDAGRRLGLEHSQEGLRFLPKSLSIVADTPKGSIPMDKMGSGENWVGYHLAMTVALHQLFVEANRPVPRFLFVDQPSQVSFPADRDVEGRMAVAAEGKTLDRERATVLHMFELLRETVAKLGGQFQVILTEHAHPDEEWFDRAIVETWRGKALIPEAWIRSAGLP